jgi:hypothetical protein
MLDLIRNNAGISITVLIGCVIGFILIIWKLDNPFDKYLEKHLFTLAGDSINGWSVTHFCLYCIFGLTMPNHLPEFIVLGIVWELLEYLLSYVDPDFWYAKKTDVPINITGYILGGLLL